MFDEGIEQGNWRGAVKSESSACTIHQTCSNLRFSAATHRAMMFPMSFLTRATTIMLQLTMRAQHQRFPATHAAFCRCHGHAVLKWQWASQAFPNRNGYNIHWTFLAKTTMDETSNTTSMDHIAQAYLHNAPGRPSPIQFPFNICT